MHDPVLITVTIVGLGGWVGFVLAAVERGTGDRRWDRFLLGSALLIATSFGTLLAYTWLARPM